MMRFIVESQVVHSSHLAGPELTDAQQRLNTVPGCLRAENRPLMRMPTRTRKRSVATHHHRADLLHILKGEDARHPSIFTQATSQVKCFWQFWCAYNKHHETPRMLRRSSSIITMANNDAVNFHGIFNGDVNKYADEEEEEEDMPACTMCHCKYNTKKDTYNWIPGGMSCCKQSVHLDCFSKWRFDNYTLDKIYVTKCHVCRTYVPAVWFFGQVYKVVKDYVNHEAVLEEIAASNEDGRVALKELRDQAPVYFTLNRREPSVSVQVFLRNELAKFKNFTLRSERTEKRINGVGVFEISYMNAKQNAFKGIPPLDIRGNEVVIDDDDDDFVDPPPRRNPPVYLVEETSDDDDELPDLINGPQVADEDYVEEINDEEDWRERVRERGKEGRREEEEERRRREEEEERRRREEEEERRRLRQQQQQQHHQGRQQRQRNNVIRTAAAKRRGIEKRHTVIDNSINRQLRIMGSFTASRVSRALKELESLGKILQKQEKSIQDLKKMKEARDALFQSASQQHRADEFISAASRASWEENTAHIASALQHAKDSTKELKDEIRIKKFDIQIIREDLERENTGGVNKFRQLSAPPVPIFDIVRSTAI